jgi:diguanylate cyclase (GGDEF)-like protein
MISGDTRHNTLPPRRVSFDKFFFVLRAFFLIGAAAWVVSTAAQIQALPGLARAMVAGAVPPLLWFLLYSVFFFALVSRFPAHRAPAFHAMMLLDTAFVTLMVRATGLGNSEFFLGYYLFIAAHTMSFGPAWGAAATVLSSALYMALYFQNPDRFFIGDFAVRTGFMFLVYFVIASIAENERKDRLRMELDSQQIDHLNRRLEKHLTELVEKNTAFSTANTILEQKQKKIDELNRSLERTVGELMEEKQAAIEASAAKDSLIQLKNEVTERRRSHIAFSKELNAKDTIEETVVLFSRYIGQLLGVDDVSVISAAADQDYLLYRPSGKTVSTQRLNAGHPILQTVIKNQDHVAEWRAEAVGETLPAGVAITDFEPAVVRAEPLLHGRAADGVFVISHPEPCAFDMDVMEETRILCNHLGVAIQNLKLRFKLQELAETDGLTGLYNHRFLQDRLDQELLRAQRYSRPLSVLLFDIDHFKRVNDTHGHRAGDAVLAELATVVSAKLRRLDILARYGGEEFIAILPETPLPGALELAERLRVAVQDHPFPIEHDDRLNITISVGAGAFPEYKTKEELIEATDQALYRAKSGGRNRVESGGHSL